MTHVHSAPAHRVEIFHDRAGVLTGAAQPEQLTHHHAVFRRAFFRRVFSLDQGGDGPFQLFHNVSPTRPTGGHYCSSSGRCGDWERGGAFRRARGEVGE